MMADMASDALIDSIITERIRKLNQNSVDIQHDLPFLVADTRRIYQQHERWLRYLPNIAPFYGQLWTPSSLTLCQTIDKNFS